VTGLVHDKQDGHTSFHSRKLPPIDAKMALQMIRNDKRIAKHQRSIGRDQFMLI